NNTESLGGEIRKISIILQTNTSTANGYVSVAPYKSEFYTANPQNPYMVGGDDFIDVLSIHEYRHALQFANTKRGIASVLYLFQGEQGWGLFSKFTVPNWFFEGDAVVTETAVTNGGRGRLSAFQQNNHANWDADKHFKYKHIRMGSYKSKMPNHYEYGYLLSSYLRDKFGNNIWAKVIESTTKLQGVIYPFSNSLKKHTGMSTSELYEEAYTHYRDEYKKRISEMEILEGEKISMEANNDITNYTFPTYLEDDLYVLKSSYSTIPEIIKISSNGDETHICYTSFTDNMGFSVSKGKISWSERTPHPRWDKYNYSDIVTYDMVSGKKNKITKNKKFFSPQLSADGKQIVVVELTKEQNCTLVILDAETGREIKRLTNKDNDYLMYPKWINENEIICSARKKGKFNISVFDIKKESKKLIWGPINQVVTDVEVSNGNYYFSATFSGIDNIYSLNPTNGVVKQISSVPVGAFWPSISSDGKKLVYSNINSEGSELREITLNKSLNKEIIIKELHEMTIFDNEAIRSEGGNIIESAEYRNDDIKKYNRFKHLFRVHSWGIKASNTEYGLTLKSENDLNTLGTEVSYTYNTNEKSHSVNGDLTYAGFWVKQVISLSSTDNRDYSYINKQQFNEKTASFSLVLPLDLSSGIYTRNLTLSSGVSEHKTKFKQVYAGLKDYSFTDYNFGFNFSNLRRSASKNIGTRWGQSLSLNYHKSFEQDVAEEFEANTRLYLPGLFENHNFELASGYKWKGTSYNYMDTFEYARGYSSVDYKDILSFTADYNLPIAYPEFGINGVFYTNRLIAKLFGDYNITDFDKTNTKREYASIGFETLFDVLLGNTINATIGIRQSFLLNNDYDTTITGSSKFEIVFRISL
ncbi:MAG: hypothetical protein HRT66_10675, partial [Flavobacteriaceae bacterium]|nr:hypothetical protein [Flavobacteriaceae bacterium]